MPMALRVLEGKPLAAKSVVVYQRSERAVKYALLSENYALLIGAIALFAVLATIMLATRKLRWDRPH